jgi:hypothetical protein
LIFQAGAVFAPMSEPTPATPSAPQPPAAAAPDGGQPSSPASAPPSAGGDPVALVKPEFLPAQFWDEKAGIKTEDFAKHYGELTVAQQKLAERAAAVPEKPEGYKVELKLPDTVQVPEGVKFDPAKDPRTPQFLQVAHRLGLDNTQVNELVALDAQIEIEKHVAEVARIAEETKKLGEKGKERIDAAKSWLTAQTGEGKTFTAAEADEIRQMVASAAGVTALEKLMAKANGGIPGHVPSNGPKPEPTTITQRWYGGNSQQKAS